MISLIFRITQMFFCLVRYLFRGTRAVHDVESGLGIAQKHASKVEDVPRAAIPTFRPEIEGVPALVLASMTVSAALVSAIPTTGNMDVTPRSFIIPLIRVHPPVDDCPRQEQVNFPRVVVTEPGVQRSPLAQATNTAKGAHGKALPRRPRSKDKGDCPQQEEAEFPCVVVKQASVHRAPLARAMNTVKHVDGKARPRRLRSGDKENSRASPSSAYALYRAPPRLQHAPLPAVAAPAPVVAPALVHAPLVILEHVEAAQAVAQPGSSAWDLEKGRRLKEAHEWSQIVKDRRSSLPTPAAPPSIAILERVEAVQAVAQPGSSAWDLEKSQRLKEAHEWSQIVKDRRSSLPTPAAPPSIAILEHVEAVQAVAQPGSSAWDLEKSQRLKEAHEWSQIVKDRRSSLPTPAAPPSIAILEHVEAVQAVAQPGSSAWDFEKGQRLKEAHEWSQIVKDRRSSLPTPTAPPSIAIPERVEAVSPVAQPGSSAWDLEKGRRLHEARKWSQNVKDRRSSLPTLPAPLPKSSSIPRPTSAPARLSVQERLQRAAAKCTVATPVVPVAPLWGDQTVTFVLGNEHEVDCDAPVSASSSAASSSSGSIASVLDALEADFQSPLWSALRNSAELEAGRIGTRHDVLLTIHRGDDGRRLTPSPF
ncbi:hypothetical protein B0H15DRAFT_43683 [Mycena belliarum]|uniref:Uncharacterized protein n=1 Tax=Mycena belliarum TaxID=1033014 RepID=A0AAD6TRA2_9AGAR|nr:hypothetical protein B0H15DRAFT_43683 [Mycena belliae]